MQIFIYITYPDQFMTKITPEGLMDHLRKKGMKNYDDYIFPENITSEYMAEEFGVHKVTIQRKLSQMEKDGVIISKRAYVKGKPSKRMVYFLKEDLTESIGNLDQARRDSIPYFGYREMMYENMERIVHLQENGDALLTFAYSVKNISTNEISEIHIPGFKYSTADLSNKFDELQSVEVNNEPVSYPLEALRYHKESQPGKVNPSISFTRSKFHSSVSYLIPLEETLKPGNVVDLKLVTKIPGSYSNLFKYEYTGITIREITLKASIKIVAPQGCQIKSVKSYEGKLFKRGIFVQEIDTGLRKDELEGDVIVKYKKGTLDCNIDRPVIGCRYLIPFFVIDQ